MRLFIGLLVAITAFAIAGVTNVVMIEAGTYTDLKSAVVMLTAIAGMTVVFHRMDRKAKTQQK